MHNKYIHQQSKLGLNKKTIVIIGGGFAGTALLKKLVNRIPNEYELILVSEESYTTFNPMLPEVVGGSIFPEQVVAPIRTMFQPGHNIRFIMGHVTKIDAQNKTIICNTLNNETSISYEHLVLGFGNRAKLDLIPGMDKFALPLKTVGDAMHIRNIVLRRIALMELEMNPETLKNLGHFIVIGGGFSGVEIAGELIDCISEICRYYPLVKLKDIKVSVLHDQDRLLLELPEPLSVAAAKSLVKRGVEIHLGARAVEITENSIKLGDGTELTAATIISTIGTCPNALLTQLDLPTERGRIIAQDDFSIANVHGMWALGDCASVKNQFDQKICPPTAQFAVRQAATLANNILAKIFGKPTIQFNYKSVGSMAVIGHKKGVATIAGINLSGLLAWFVWRSYYLFLMPTWGRKIRIYLEWTWGMFFPVDITHLRFNRSVDNESQVLPPPILTQNDPTILEPIHQNMP